MGLGKSRQGPLLDVGGALWVLLQRLHDLAAVHHEPHHLVLPLGFRRAVDGPDELQLLQVLEPLQTKRTRPKWVTPGQFEFLWTAGRGLTFTMTGGLKLYMELDLRCRNFLNSESTNAPGSVLPSHVWRKMSQSLYRYGPFAG